MQKTEGGNYRNFKYPIIKSNSPSPIKTPTCPFNTKSYMMKGTGHDKISLFLSHGTITLEFGYKTYNLTQNIIPAAALKWRERFKQNIAAFSKIVVTTISHDSAGRLAQIPQRCQDGHESRKHQVLSRVSHLYMTQQTRDRRPVNFTHHIRVLQCTSKKKKKSGEEKQSRSRCIFIHFLITLYITRTM